MTLSQIRSAWSFLPIGAARTRRTALPVLTEPFSLMAMLKADHEVIGIANQCTASCHGGLEAMIEPQIQNIMQVDIRQKRRQGTSLRRALVAAPDNPTFHDASLQPFRHQTQKRAVSD